MGLLDKLTKAAKTAAKVKDALESSGILGEADGARATNDSGDRPGSGWGGDRSPGYRQLVERCVTDPFDLVSPAEVAELTGLDIGPAGEWHSDDCVGVELRTRGTPTSYWVRVDSFPTRPTPTRPPDAESTWRFVSTETPEPRVPIEGLGDEALSAGGAVVCVKVNEQVLVINGHLPDAADVPEVLTAIARIAAGRA